MGNKQTTTASHFEDPSLTNKPTSTDETAGNSKPTLTDNHSEAYNGISSKLVSPSTSNFVQELEIIQEATTPTKPEDRIIGVFIKEATISHAYHFWSENVNSLTPIRKEEFQILLFSKIFIKIPSAKKLLLRHGANNMGSTCFKMIAWVLESFHDNEPSLYLKLRKLSSMHKSIGVKPEYYQIFVDVLHCVLGEFFESSYTVTVRYCVDRIFTLTMGFMMGLELDQLPQFCMKFLISEATKSDMKWLGSQEETIHDPTGFQYLCRFLEVHSCSEYVWFLKIYLEFEYAMSDKQRLVIARKMIDCCMTPGEPFEINISYEMREQCIKNVKDLNASFHRGEEVIVPPDMFDFVYKEIKKLIRDNYWLAFEKLCLAMPK